MLDQIIYKKWYIDHVYDCSEGYNEIDHYAIWTPNRLDVTIISRVIMKVKNNNKVKQCI